MTLSWPIRRKFIVDARFQWELIAFFMAGWVVVLGFLYLGVNRILSGLTAVCPTSGPMFPDMSRGLYDTTAPIEDLFSSQFPGGPSLCCVIWNHSFASNCRPHL